MLYLKLIVAKLILYMIRLVVLKEIHAKCYANRQCYLVFAASAMDWNVSTFCDFFICIEEYSSAWQLINVN